MSEILRGASVILCPFLLCTLAACTAHTPDSDLPEGTFVGALQGSDARVAVTVADSEVVAYACGGALTIDIHTGWFRGTLEGDTVSLSSASGAAGNLTFSGDQVSGTLTTSDGNVHDLVDVQRSVPGTATGLFSAVDAGCRTGVIVQQDSAEGSATVQGAWCQSTAESDIFQQVTPITPVLPGLTTLKVQVNGMNKELTTVLVDPTTF